MSQSRALPGGASRERKIATLLFADLADFTALGESHDPERVSAVVGATFERLAREVQRYEGTVEKFAGDALLAVFGVPAVHEDDPERAVRAALEMQAVMAEMESSADGRPKLALRIGVESGEVLADRARASGERDLFVTGDAVNTAARLEAAAKPGTVVVGPTTHGATHHIVYYRELPPLELKGKAAPVVAWQAVAVRTGRGGRRAPPRLDAPFVGREAELARVKESVADATEKCRPQLVTVLGSAGVGKSRLVWELEKYLDGLPELYHWRKGRCLAYAGPSFGPIADIAKADARISDDEPPAEAREKLAARLEQLPLGEKEPTVRDALEAVLGIGAERERSRGELFEAWRHYLEAIARLHPLVLVVEDIHWADDAMLSFLDLVARWGEGPIALVCLARHELLEVRAGWGAGLSEATTVALEPLGETASAKLVGGLLGGGVPRPVQEHIAELAEGNPLFAEELVRMLVDQGALRSADGAWHLARPLEEVEVPGSIQAVIAARLDTLPDGEKRVAQHAAVIGRVFWDRLLARLAGADLDSVSERLRGLRVKDLVIGREPSVLAGAAEYGFRHVLVRDVAYESLPKRERSRLHREIATWAEESLADRIDEYAELIASHLLAAVRLERELEPVDGAELRALRSLAYPAALRAARRASSLGLISGACTWMQAAYELAVELGESALAVASLVDEDASIHGSLADAADHVAMVTAAADGLLGLGPLAPEDAELLARVRSAQGQALFGGAAVDGARDILRRGLRELEAGRSSPGRSRLLRTLGWTYWRAGPVEDAAPLLERAVTEARTCGDEDALRWALHELGISHSFFGRDDLAVELVEESYQLALEDDDGPLVSRCKTNLPLIRRERGDALEPLAAMAAEGLREDRRAGVSVAYPAANLSAFMMEMARLEEALAYADEAVASAESRGQVGGNWLVLRSIIHRVRGDTSSAERDESMALRYRVYAEPQTKCETLLASAWATWARDPAGALTGLAHDLEDGGPSHEMHWLDGLHEVARMALRLGDETGLEQAVERHRRGRWPGGPALGARYRWADGLVADDGGVAIEEAATSLVTVGYVRKAMDAWTDAAIMAARAGRSSDARERAQALADTTGMHPLLGLPSETEPRSRTAQ